MFTQQRLSTFVNSHLTGFRSSWRRFACSVLLGIGLYSQAHATEVIGYYQGGNASTVPLKNLVTNGSAAALNYLIYAFAEPEASGACELNPSQQTADIGTVYTAEDSVSGLADSGTLHGNFNQILELKKKYPNLKVLISLGGNTLSGNFSAMASAVQAGLTAKTPNNPVTSCVQTLIQGYPGVFDGIDIDWEYPAQKDTANYTALLQGFRKALTAAQKSGATYILTTTMGPAANASGYQYINVAQAAEIVDYVNVMSYDYAGSWSGGTGFDAPLNASPINTSSSLNISGSEWYTYNVAATFTANTQYTQGFVPQFKTAGIPASKLILGVPFYGLEWDQVSGSEAQTYHGLYVPGTWVNSLSYANIAQNFVSNASLIKYCDYGSTSSPYSCSANPGGGSQETWLYDGSSTFVSYDDETAVAAKVKFATTNKLGGVMAWDLSQDSPGGCLMNAIWTNMSSGNKTLNPDTTLYNFEAGAQGWTSAAGNAKVAVSEGQAQAGCRSLGVTFTDSSAITSTAYVLSPSVKPGQTITLHIWIPTDSHLSSINPFITNTSWAWLASAWTNAASLVAGQWNTMSFTIPTSAPTTFGELGVEFSSTEPWSGTVYIDSVSN